MSFDFTLDRIEEAARWLLQTVPQGKVFAVEGEMGAGKTTFISAVCRVLGATDHPSSPTFALIHQYRSAQNGTIYHTDLYRLKDESEAANAGIEDILYSGCYCFAEWPGRAPGIFPPQTIYLQIKILGADKRQLLVEDESSGKPRPISR